MSENERIPLAEINKNEEMISGNEVEDNGRQKLQENSPGTSVSDASFMNPIMSAAVRRDTYLETSFFKETKLLELDVKENDSLQRNIFHYAVSKPGTLKKLLKNAETKTFVQDALYQADKEGETPIHRAAITASIESLQLLHEHDNSLMKLKTTKGKRSVLHLAVKSRSLVAVKFVHSKDPDLVNAVDSMLQSPVHHAASLKESSILEFLISKECDTTKTDANDQLPMHIATIKGLRKNVELLLRSDPNVLDALDNFDQSPILLAAKNGFPNVVSYLLAQNANYKLKDKDGLTAFDWALCRTLPKVVEVFLNTDKWKEVVSWSHQGPERSLAIMIKSMPEMAKMLLDKCLTTKGTKDNPGNYQVKYDFFCLESKDEKGSCPRFQALHLMAEDVSEICLHHPVAVKYVDTKWRKRGFKYIIALILLTLLFHICLMVYTTRVIGVVDSRTEIRQDSGRNVTMKTRDGRPPNAVEMVALRVIILIITTGEILKEVLQMMAQRFHYLTSARHYYRLSLCISVMLYLLPVNEELTAKQIGCGAVTVMLSWTNLMEFLKLVPVIGIYIILVEKIFWTLMKIFVVVLIYLLSFASTFYVLLAEHDSFRNIYISFVSTFVSMMDGIHYDTLFVAVGWYPRIYEIKLVVLVLFILTMSIVVNNALIGLAVGDANEIMKSASFDKFRQRAKFVIELERSLNNVPCMKCVEDKCLIEFPELKKNLFQKGLDLLYFGGKIDAVDSDSEGNEHEHEMEITLEAHFEKAMENKLENLRSSLRHELKEIRDEIKEDLDEKVRKILEKLN